MGEEQVTAAALSPRTARATRPRTPPAPGCEGREGRRRRVELPESDARVRPRRRAPSGSGLLRLARGGQALRRHVDRRSGPEGLAQELCAEEPGEEQELELDPPVDLNARAAPKERRLDLRHLPGSMQHALNLEPQVAAWADKFAPRQHALFLGRGMHYPIALEGALKLKEISYIHAEAYPAGELKHGPLALVDANMPVVVIAPNDSLLEKVKSNIQEVRARGGELFVFADANTRISAGDGVHVIRMPEHYGKLSPILHVVPLQLLAYHAAVARGTDVDKPRNLAKSVTVEGPSRDPIPSAS